MTITQLLRTQIPELGGVFRMFNLIDVEIFGGTINFEIYGLVKFLAEGK